MKGEAAEVVDISINVIVVAVVDDIRIPNNFTPAGGAPVRVHEVAVVKVFANVTRQFVGAPVPVVTFPAVSFPVIEGEVPQRVTTGLGPEVTKCPTLSMLKLGSP